MRSWTPSPSVSLVNAGWHRDSQNRLVLLRVPPQVSLDRNPRGPHNPEQDGNINAAAPHGRPTDRLSPPSPRQAISITSLPTELIHEVTDLLHPVDRVCLALTCKPLASAILSAPRLSPAGWSHFADLRYEWLLPESYSLILRLAHGWIPKDKLRYCWKCHKILPRDAAYFRARLACKRKPRWSLKLDVPKMEWDGMSKMDRYRHLVETWASSPCEDSSSLSCDLCRDQCLGSPNAQLQHPVQCPLCLEKELTYVWRPPRKTWFRKNMYKAVELLCHSVQVVFWHVVLLLRLVGRFVYDQGQRCWRALPC